MEYNLVISEKCPIENYTDLETYPKIHNDIENDQGSKGKLVGGTICSTSGMLIGSKDPQEAYDSPGQAAQKV